MAVARLRFFDRGEEESIHSESLRWLEKLGVMVKSPSVLGMLERAGATVDPKKGVARIPEAMVKEALAKAPKSFKLGARDQKHQKEVPVRTYPLMATTGLAVNTVDIGTGEERPTTNRDLAEFSRMADAMDPIDICWTTVTATDVPQEALALESLWTVLKNNTKHVQVIPATHGAEDARKQVELASLVAGGEKTLRKAPIFSVISCSIAPLTFAGAEIEAQAEFARHGIPVVSMSMSIAGLSSPVTMGGTLVNINAENLASLVITQAAGPGAPFIYSSESAPMDMMTGVMDYTSYHLPLVSAAAGQMAARYGLPSLVSSWGLETKKPGMEGSFSESFGMTLNTFGGSDMMSGAGSLDHAKGASLEQVVLDSHLWADIRKFMKGYTISKDTFAMDVVEAVGHGNSFLTQPHTVKNFRSEHPIRDRARRHWQATMSTKMAAEAREEAKSILKEHVVPPLDKEILEKGASLIKGYEKNLSRH